MVYVYGILANYGGSAFEGCNYPLVTYLSGVDYSPVYSPVWGSLHETFIYALDSLLRRRFLWSSRNLCPVGEEDCVTCRKSVCRLRRTVPKIWHVIFRNGHDWPRVLDKTWLHSVTRSRVVFNWASIILSLLAYMIGLKELHDLLNQSDGKHLCACVGQFWVLIGCAVYVCWDWS